MSRIVDIDELVELSGRNAADKGFHAHGDRLRRLLDTAIEVDEITSTEESREMREFFEQMHREHFGNRLMLIGDELSEVHEALREGHDLDHLYLDEKGKPEGPAAELADVAIRLFDLCWEAGVDLPSAIATKMAFNASRPALHGKKF